MSPWEEMAVQKIRLSDIEPTSGIGRMLEDSETIDLHLVGCGTEGI